MVVPGSVHRVIDEQGYNDGTQNNHPIGNLSASYRCFPPKPFHDFHPWLDRTQLALLSQFRWWLFRRLPREDATADYECGHDRPENPKLHLLHCGVLRQQHHYEPL